MAADNEKKTLDYAVFLADLEAKRAVLDQAIASIKAMMAGGTLALSVGDSISGMADNVSVALHGGEVPAGAFHSKSIPEAAKLYLSLVKRKQSTREIADALLKGGMESNSKNFETTVAGGLYRAFKTNGEIVRVKGGWGLAAWWPAGVRTTQEKGKTRKAKKSRRLKTVNISVATESNGQKKPQEQIAEFLKGSPSKIYTPQEVSQALGMQVRTVAPTLGRLAASKLVEKVESGKYRAAHA